MSCNKRSAAPSMTSLLTHEEERKLFVGDSNNNSDGDGGEERRHLQLNDKEDDAGSEASNDVDDFDRRNDNDFDSCSDHGDCDDGDQDDERSYDFLLEAKGGRGDGGDNDGDVGPTIKKEGVGDDESSSLLLHHSLPRIRTPVIETSNDSSLHDIISKAAATGGAATPSLGFLGSALTGTGFASTFSERDTIVGGHQTCPNTTGHPSTSPKYSFLDNRNNNNHKNNHHEDTSEDIFDERTNDLEGFPSFHHERRRNFHNVYHHRRSHSSGPTLSALLDHPVWKRITQGASQLFGASGGDWGEYRLAPNFDDDDDDDDDHLDHENDHVHDDDFRVTNMSKGLTGREGGKDAVLLMLGDEVKKLMGRIHEMEGQLKEMRDKGVRNEDKFRDSDDTWRERAKELEEEVRRLKSVNEDDNSKDGNDVSQKTGRTDQAEEDQVLIQLSLPKNGERKDANILSEKDKEEEVFKDWPEVLSSAISPMQRVTELTPDQISRYSRQLLLSDGFGVEGQCKLLSSSVLVVGAGGIGSTVLLYLAASGVGRISVIDFDNVDTSNLHRQVIHKNNNVGMNKAVSACRAVCDLNPTIQCHPVLTSLTHENALDIVSRHDCIVDACDNPRTRYLVNDACVLAGKLLVSGSAMGTEGQMTVYGYKGGACYRCLYPKPDSKEGCKSCSDNGVLGPVPGLIGILQATEVLKLLTGIGSTMHDRLLMYDSLQCSFMSIKKPPANKKCPVCGPDATIRTMEESRIACRDARGPNVVSDNEDDGGEGTMKSSATKGLMVTSLPPKLNISCKDYCKIRRDGIPHVLLDVRVRRQYEMCALEGSINIPLEELEGQLGKVEELSNGSRPVYCLCRRGIASAEATRIISEAISAGTEKRYNRIHSVRNISGGLNAWVDEVDASFPKY